jgi:hypothetical protein
MAWTERYVRSDAAGGGNGTTNTNSGANGAWTLAEGITNAAAGHRVNVRAGTYTNTTTTRTFATAGTTTAPVWWRGFNTSIGDLDDDHTLAMPLISFTTGGFAITGTYQWFSHLDINGARTGDLQVNFSTGTNCKMDRCRIENTGTAAASGAVRFGTNDHVLTRCWLKAPSTATRVVQLNSNRTAMHGCFVTGGGVGIDITVSTSCVITHCVVLSTGGIGIQNITTGVIFLIGNTVNLSGGDAINLNTSLPSFAVIVNNILAGATGWGINQATGANTDKIIRFGNDFYSNSSGTETGFGDSPSLVQLAETASPFVSATDLRLLPGAVARKAGFPQRFENQTFLSYEDVGAVQAIPVASRSNPLGVFRWAE